MQNQNGTECEYDGVIDGLVLLIVMLVGYFYWQLYGRAVVDETLKDVHLQGSLGLCNNNSIFFFLLRHAKRLDNM